MDTSMSEDRGAYKEAWGLNIQWDLPMNKAMFQYTVALGLCVLVLIVLGAVYTSEIQRMPGSNAPAVTASTAGEMSLELAHSVAGWIVAALTLGLAVWLRSPLAWMAFAMVLLDGWSGMTGTLRSMPRASGFLHALLGQFLLTVIVVVGAGVHIGKGPEVRLKDSSRPSIRSLAISASHLAALQVILGAAYRHGVMGVLLHLLNALAVAIVVLMVCLFVTRQFPGEPSLRVPAIALAIVTGVQVLLGFADFTLLLVGSEGNALLILGVAHVSMGAVTSAASFLLATQVRRRLVRASVTPA